MSLTLKDLYEKKNDSDFRNKVTAACWSHAKTLLQGATPTPQQLNQAVELLNKQAPDKYVIAVAVIIDDGTVDDAAILSAVGVAAGKLLTLIP